MNAKTITLLGTTVASRTRHYGPGDPRTIAARRAWLLARAQAAEAEAARLRAQAEALAVA
jgi:hypothetical protein